MKDGGLDSKANYDRTILPLEGTIVIVTSMAAFFQRLLQAEGRYYFDSPDFVPIVPALARRYEIKAEDD